MSFLLTVWIFSCWNSLTHVVSKRRSDPSSLEGTKRPRMYMPELPSLRWMLIDVDRLMEGKLAREMAET